MILGTVFHVATACVIATSSAGVGGGQVVQRSREALTSSNTLFGPTGLINVPTAYVTQHGKVQFSTSFGEDIRGPAANYGITPGVEIGGAFIDREGRKNKGIANAKVNIIPANFDFFEVGVGVIDAADAITRSYYVVGSADFAIPRAVEDRAIGFRLHFGAGTGMFEDEFIFGGELQLDPKFSIIGEYDAKDFNGVLRYSHDRNFRVQGGVQGSELFFGATYLLEF